MQCLPPKSINKSKRATIEKLGLQLFPRILTPSFRNKEDDKNLYNDQWNLYFPTAG